MGLDAIEAYSCAIHLNTLKMYFSYSQKKYVFVMCFLCYEMLSENLISYSLATNHSEVTISSNCEVDCF